MISTHSITIRNCLFIFFFFVVHSVFSQHPIINNFFVDSAAHATKQFYKTSLGANARLYNGVEFKDYIIHNYDEGFPYFLSDDWIEGEIHYDGQQYKNVYMIYDLVRDKIIIEHFNSHFKIELIDEKIKSFSITATMDNITPDNMTGNIIRGSTRHNFVRLVPDSADKPIIKSGYYDILYDGVPKLYAKRSKDVQRSINANIEVTKYKPQVQFFLYKDHTFYSVKSKASMLKVFADRKNLVRKYLSENKIKFGKNREYAMAMATKFYDESAK